MPEPLNEHGTAGPDDKTTVLPETAVALVEMERLQQAPQSRLHLPCGLLRLERQASERFGNRAAGGGIVILRQSIEQRPCDQRRLRW